MKIVLDTNIIFSDFHLKVQKSTVYANLLNPQVIQSIFLQLLLMNQSISIVKNFKSVNLK